MPLHVAHWRVLLRGQVIAGDDLTPPEFLSGEEGDVTHATLVVTFSENVSASDYALGVTVKYDAVSQTISSATRQTNEAIVHYLLSADPITDDTITWEYSDTVGDYQDAAGNQMGDRAASACTNNIGTHAIFDNAADSMHALATMRL